MRAPITSLFDWLHERTGYRAGLRHLLDEPLPPGAGWWFTLGSVLLLLLAAQIVTGAVLTLYYVPTPDHAWSSVRFIIDQVTFGRIVRNLHYYGASFIVIAAGAHLLRSFFFGSYKAPREVTWVSGVLLLLVIMAFALTGYLLPWDQRAYWATVVTLNVARTAPGLGEFAAGVLRGGAELGALTLSRWYAAHVILLPAALAVLVVTHLYLMRRHRISGPITPVPGVPQPFYPAHAVKDAIVGGGVFLLLIGLAVAGRAPLEPVADPTDATYTPRPEWYFMWLFQLLKYFPGKLEVLGAHGIPALLVTTMLLLPFLDRRPERRPWKRPIASAMALVIVVAIGALTSLGLRDVPEADEGRAIWNAEARGGRLVAQEPRCTRCHREDGVAASWARLRVTRDNGWIKAHAADPDIIGPGVRTPPSPPSEQEQHAVVAFARALASGVPAPEPRTLGDQATALIGRHCLGCHVLDGRGKGQAPNLARAGREHDATWLAGWITDPTAYEYDTDMPAFGPRLPKEQIDTLARYLATRK